MHEEGHPDRWGTVEGTWDLASVVFPSCAEPWDQAVEVTWVLSKPLTSRPFPLQMEVWPWGRRPGHRPVPCLALLWDHGGGDSHPCTPSGRSMVSVNHQQPPTGGCQNCDPALRRPSQEHQSLAGAITWASWAQPPCTAGGVEEAGRAQRRFPNLGTRNAEHMAQKHKGCCLLPGFRVYFVS